MHRKPSMNLRNELRNALFLLLLYFGPSSSQIITEVDVPELQLLASNLQPEECVKLVSLDSLSPLSEAQIQKLAREQSCFRMLVKWICQLRTVTRNTYPILNDLLERIGRRDLIACLGEFNMRTSQSPKVIREAQAEELDSDYDSGMTTVAAPKPRETEPQQDSKADTVSPTDALAKISGRTTFKVSLKTAGIVIASTILATCCCTLIVRNRLANLLGKLRGKKKKGFIAIEDDADVSKSYFIRKPRVKRKRAPSYEMVHAATQNTIVAAPKEPEEPAPTGCYKCYKKKRKKSTKRPHR